jgi:hypothetical protein
VYVRFAHWWEWFRLFRDRQARLGDELKQRINLLLGRLLVIPNNLTNRSDNCPLPPPVQPGDQITLGLMAEPAAMLCYQINRLTQRFLNLWLKVCPI